MSEDPKRERQENHQKDGRKKYVTIKNLLAIIITAACFYVLFRFIHPADIIKAIKNISLPVLLGGFVLYTASYLFRAWRFRALVNKAIPMAGLFALVSVHTMANNLLPARTGELSYLYLRKKLDAETTLSSGIASLVIARIFDLIALLALFITAWLLTDELPRFVTTLLHVISGMVMAIIALLFLIVFYGKRVSSLAHRIIVMVRLDRLAAAAWLEKKMEESIGSISAMSSRKTMAVVFFCSVMVWLINFAVAYLLVRDMGLPLGFWMVIIGFTATTLANALPIHGFASLGSLEGIWALVFIAFGAPKDIAIASGFGFHLVLIAYFVILGLAGVGYMKWKGKKASSPKDI
ncbi:flippase-like domain-containing protein [Candidatus Woesearchaeota archaeon]|nr:flippase-like domain-containing protein [Candidatus Woesearchaeota archaeon]